MVLVLNIREKSLAAGGGEAITQNCKIDGGRLPRQKSSQLKGGNVSVNLYSISLSVLKLKAYHHKSHTATAVALFHR